MCYQCTRAGELLPWTECLKPVIAVHEDMKTESKVLLAAVCFLFIFSLAIKFKGDLNTQIIEERAQIFDGQLKEFHDKTYERIRPYINVLADQYKSSVSIASTASGMGKNLDTCVKKYSVDRNDKNFGDICKVLAEIRAKNSETDFGRDLIRAAVGPLTLSVFFLAPFPTTFTKSAQAEMLKNEIFKSDPLLKFVATLRISGIYRGLFTKSLWTLEYLEKRMFYEKFGNVLSFVDNASYNERIRALISELKISFEDASKLDNSFGDLVEMNSKATIITLDIKPRTIAFNIHTQHLVNDSIDLFDSSKTDAIIVKTKQRATCNSVQISETLIVNSDRFLLKAMILKNKQKKEYLMVFDTEFYFWTLFDGKKVLAVPRQFARKIFNEEGTNLIYVKTKN